MATVEGVIQCWAVLEATGLRRPWDTADECERAAQVWSLVLGDVPDDQLATLCVAWLRSDDARYGRWPLPGALLAALPGDDEVDDGDDAWAEALGLISLFGVDRCPVDVAALEDIRTRAIAGYRKAEAQGNAALQRRYRMIRESLPSRDTHRTEALLRGVAACGGWRGLGRASDDQLVAHRASFRAAYRGQRKRRRLNETERRVAGLLDGNGGPGLRLVGPVEEG